MKHIIAATVIALSSSAATADSFTYERAFGTPALFSTLVTDQVQARPSSGKTSASFAHERAFGTPALYSTLVSEGAASKPRRDATAKDIPIWRDIFAREADLRG